MTKLNFKSSSKENPTMIHSQNTEIHVLKLPGAINLRKGYAV